MPTSIFTSRVVSVPNPEPNPHELIESHNMSEPERSNAARPRVGGSSALQDIINAKMADQEEAKRVNAAKAAELGIDINATAKKWSSKNTSVFPNGPPQPVAWPAKPSAAEQKAALSPKARAQAEDVTVSDQVDIMSPETDAHFDHSSIAPVDISSPESVEFTGGSSTPNDSEMSDPQTRNGQTDTHISVRSFSLKLKNGGSKEEKGKQKRVTLPGDTPIPKLLPATLAAESSKMSAARAPRDVDHSPSLFVRQVDRYTVEPLPKWHEDITTKNLEMQKINRRRPEALKLLDNLKKCIVRCEHMTMQRSNVKSKNPKLLGLFDELRGYVHEAEIKWTLNKYIVRSPRILHPDTGLPRIFREDTQFPPDLKADSYQLYLRWMREDFEQNVLRGIITVKGPNRGSDKLDQTYRAKHPATAKYYGDKGLVIGQCWPSQLCTVRDGAHGSSQGVIFGDKDNGAYSIVLSGGGGYNDEDNGDTILYSGTNGQDFTPTEATQQMLRSAKLRNEIRVIRSANLHRNNQYRPVIGFRYDGLYTITDFELIDKQKQIHRFRLERCPGQIDIRCGDNAVSRPTQYEIKEYKGIKLKHRWA